MRTEASWISNCLRKIYTLSPPYEGHQSVLVERWNEADHWQSRIVDMKGVCLTPLIECIEDDDLLATIGYVIVEAHPSATRSANQRIFY